MAITNQKLLENFDDEVREKLRLADRDSKSALNRIENLLMALTRHELRGHARFGEDGRFELVEDGLGAGVPLGVYELPRRSDDAHIYRLNHPLAERAVERAKTRDLPFAEVCFALAGKVSALEPYVDSGGVLCVDLLRGAALGQTEEYLLLNALADNGDELDEAHIRRLLSFPAVARPTSPVADLGSLDTISARKQSAILDRVSMRNLRYFEEEAEKLDSWADDLKNALEREIKDIDREIREAKKQAKAALTLEAKLDGQRTVKALERERTNKRKRLFEAQDEIDEKRDALIGEIESRLQQDTSRERLFTIRWGLQDGA